MALFRKLIRSILLLVSIAVLGYGIVNGAIPASPTDPPNDSIWLLSLAAAFPMLLGWAWLSIGGANLSGPYNKPSMDARFRRNVQQVGVSLLVGFALLTLHLLREQIVAANSIKDTTVVTASGAVIQDPRKVPAELRVRRGNIYTGSADMVIASTEVISPSRYAHRIYPEPNISYLAGYYNPTIYGSAGLESSYDKYLSGSEVLNPLTEQQRRILHRPVVGNDLHLTIVPALQNVAQEALGNRKGAVVLLDAQSGAILAMASWPHIDPQRLSFNPYLDDWGVENKRVIDYYQSVLNDPSRPLLLSATQGLYPPGSTFKTVSSGAAIDTNIAQPNTVYSDTKGTVQVEAGGYLHRDCSTCRPANHGPTFSLAEGYKWSLNVVFAELGVQIGANRMEEYAGRFGVGTRYDIGLPVEVSRLSSDSSELNSPNLLAATAYGQGKVQTTPLQMAMVAAVVAHGGDLPAPYLVSSVTDPDTGNAIYRFEPHTLQHVLSPQSNDTLRAMMLTSIESGWAHSAAIPGAVVGGKTGTAETGRGTSHSWFIGFAGRDAKRPQYAIATFVDEGGEGTRVALPLARTVLVAALGQK
ncbi:MAG: penicillin-binding protein 2 [Chloroflexota bacterium]|nr:penicillin-binding protein 2 [Chloroflexota bacterium]